MNNVEENKISVLLIEPNKYPKMIEIEDTLEAMQSYCIVHMEGNKFLSVNCSFRNSIFCFF